MAKKIVFITSIVLLLATLVLGIITLVNYYSYVSVLNKLSNTEIDVITKFDLRENSDTYLYKTLKTVAWTCYLAIFATISTIATLIMHRPKQNQLKIR